MTSLLRIKRQYDHIQSLLQLRDETIQLRKRELEDEIGDLEQERTTIQRQARRERNDRDRLLLQRQADDLLATIEKREAELEQLENAEPDPNRRDRNIKQYLPELDLKEAMATFGRAMDSFEDRPGALLVLVENSRAMAGKLCRDRIREKLRPRTAAPSFRHISIGPPNGLGAGSELDLFQGLADYFQVEIANAEPGPTLARATVEKLCCSLRSGTIFLIEIERWDEFEQQDRVLNCFLEQFWRPLINRLAAPEVQEELAYVKIVAAIDSPSLLSQECSALPCYCEPDCFASDQVLRLPLRAWQVSDIQAWLCQYWQFKKQEAQRRSQLIYRQSEQGLPRLVCDALEDFLARYQPSTD